MIMKTVLPFLISGSLVAGLLLALAGCGRRVVSMPPAADAAAGELAVDDSPEQAKEAFPFPEDRGGRLLAELLPPRETLPPLNADRPSGPLPLRAARPIER